MKHILPPTAMAVLILGGVLVAQSAAPTSPSAPSPSMQAPASTPPAAGQAPAPNQPRIAPGSIIPVQLTKTVDAKKAKSGDEVVAKVTMDMKTDSGQVLVPKDTKVIGHVTEAQARNKKEEKQSQLAISFNQAVLNNQQVQLPMSIQAVIGQENNNADNSNSSSAPGGSSPSPSPSSTGTGASSPMNTRSPNSGSNQPQAPTSTGSGSDNAEQSGSKRPQINAKTQGVIGISNLTLGPGSTGEQGSVLTSEKNNVKLESGTMLLLKVSQ